MAVIDRHQLLANATNRFQAGRIRQVGQIFQGRAPVFDIVVTAAAMPRGGEYLEKAAGMAIEGHHMFLWDVCPRQAENQAAFATMAAPARQLSVQP
jgi:hypothetical protein